MQNVLIKGKMAMNRAFNGDTVVVELLPESEWQAPSSKLPGQRKGKAQDDVGPAEATVAQVLPPPACSVPAPRARCTVCCMPHSR